MYKDLTKLSFKKLALMIGEVYDYQHEDLKVISPFENKERDNKLNDIIIALHRKAEMLEDKKLWQD